MPDLVGDVYIHVDGTIQLHVTSSVAILPQAFKSQSQSQLSACTLFVYEHGICEASSSTCGAQGAFKEVLEKQTSCTAVQEANDKILVVEIAAAKAWDNGW
jgi:hypothetical protein